jgi:hypothetical protein
LEDIRAAADVLQKKQENLSTQAAQMEAAVKKLTDSLPAVADAPRQAQLEEMYLGQYFPGRQVPCAIDHDRYRRRFRIPEQEDSRILGQAVAQYIRWFDQVLKAYFARLGLPDAADAAQAAYLNGLQQTEWII